MQKKNGARSLLLAMSVATCGLGAWERQSAADPTKRGAAPSNPELGEITGWIRGKIEHEIARLVDPATGFRMHWKWDKSSFDGCSFQWMQTLNITANDVREGRGGQTMLVGRIEHTYSGSLSNLYYPPEIRIEKPHAKANFDLHFVILRTIDGNKVVTDKSIVENAANQRTMDNKGVAELGIGFLEREDAQRVQTAFADAIRKCNGKASPY